MHTVTLKPIHEVAKYKKAQIPANIPETYAIKPIYENIANAEEIRSGVVAFRDFLYTLFDRLATDGHDYAKPPKKPGGMSDYPFLHYLTNILVEIGYYGELAGSGTLAVARLPLATPSEDADGKKRSAKIPSTSLVECMKFLAICGFSFMLRAGSQDSTELSEDSFQDIKKPNIANILPLEVSYPDNPALLVGLKALAVADIERRSGPRVYWNDHNLLRCNYRPLMANEPSIYDELKDFLQPLPKDVQAVALKLHERYTGKGLTCTQSILDDTSYSYAHISKANMDLPARSKYQKRIWAFSYSMRHGYSLFVRAKKTDKYADVIKTFPQGLQEIISQGYGCYRKMGGSICQVDCQGIRIPLDESLLAIAGYIEMLLDNEMPSSLK